MVYIPQVNYPEFKVVEPRNFSKELLDTAKIYRQATELNEEKRKEKERERKIKEAFSQPSNFVSKQYLNSELNNIEKLENASKNLENSGEIQLANTLRDNTQAIKTGLSNRLKPVVEAYSTGLIKDIDPKTKELLDYFGISSIKPFSKEDEENLKLKRQKESADYKLEVEKKTPTALQKNIESQYIPEEKKADLYQQALLGKPSLITTETGTFALPPGSLKVEEVTTKEGFPIIKSETSVKEKKAKLDKLTYLAEESKKVLPGKDVEDIKSMVEYGDYPDAKIAIAIMKNDYLKGSPAFKALEGWENTIKSIEIPESKELQQEKKDEKVERELKADKIGSKALQSGNIDDIYKAMAAGVSKGMMKALSDKADETERSKSIKDAVDIIDIATIDEYNLILKSDDEDLIDSYLNRKIGTSKTKDERNYWKDRKSEFSKKTNINTRKNLKDLEDSIPSEKMEEWYQVKNDPQKLNNFVINNPSIAGKIIDLDKKVQQLKASDARIEGQTIANDLKRISLNAKKNEKVFSRKEILEASNDLSKLNLLLKNARSDTTHNKDQIKQIEALIKSKSSAEKANDMNAKISEDFAKSILNNPGKDISNKFIDLAMERMKYAKGSKADQQLDEIENALKNISNSKSKEIDNKIKIFKQNQKEKAIKMQEDAGNTLAKIRATSDTVAYLSAATSIAEMQGKDIIRHYKELEEEIKKNNTPKEARNFNILKDADIPTEQRTAIWNTNVNFNSVKDILKDNDAWKELEAFTSSRRQFSDLDAFYTALQKEIPNSKAFELFNKIRLFRIKYGHSYFGASLTGNELQALNEIITTTNWFTNPFLLRGQFKSLGKKAFQELKDIDDTYDTNFVSYIKLNK